MAKEIERKYLVKSDEWRAVAKPGKRLIQGYLSSRGSGGATVRVRIIDDREARLTIKGPNHGLVRDEWEYPIPIDDARDMLKLAIKPPLDKTRWVVDAAEPGLRWEIDEFHGANEGLVTAEIELPSPDTPFTLPSFIGADVTGNPRFYNSNL